MSSKYEIRQQLTPHLTPLAAAISGVLVAGQVEATTITVTTLLDGSLSGQCTLRSALEASQTEAPVDSCPAGSGSDEIVFASALSGDLQLTQGTLQVNSGVTIDGDERVTVRGDGSSRVFGVVSYAAPVTFRNITIADGFSDGRGGGIDALTGSLTLSNVSLINNTTTTDGGGLFVDTYGSLLIENSLISGNTAALSGGGVNLNSRGPSSVTLSNNVFENNQAGRGAGAHLYKDNNTAYDTDFLIKDNLFSSNTIDTQGSTSSTLGFGGGLSVSTLFNVDPVLEGNRFENNVATRSGGGLILFSYSDSSATTLHLEDNIFTSNEAGEQGGGAWINTTQSLVYADDSRFFDNQAETAAGLYVGGGYGLFLERLVAENNQADDDGGGVLIASSGSVSLADSRFLDNSAATGCGGGIQFTGQSPLILVERSIFRDNYAGGCGGGIAFQGWDVGSAQVLISSSEFSGNEAAGGLGGGAILTNFTNDSTMILANSTISGNTAQYRGGGLKVEGSSLTLSVGYSTFAYNHADDRGGGIDAVVPNCIVLNSLFADNTYGADQEPQELYTPACPVQHSLISNIKYSQFEPGAGVIADEEPLILPLADNGGSNGYTHALQPDSPAIDAGNAGGLTPPFDQRGAPFARVFGSSLDIGAFEFSQDRVFSDRFESGSSP